MQKSEQINEIAAALSKAQAAMPPAKKESTNPFFGSSYADLASVVDAVRKPLAENNLAVCQTFNASADASTVTIETTLLHSSGQFITGELTLRPVKADPQGIGSACTYGRRYSLMAICGLAAEDDDGNAATHGKAEPANAAAPKPAPPAKPADNKKDGRAVLIEMATKFMGDPVKGASYLADIFGCEVSTLDPVKDRNKMASAYTQLDAALIAAGKK